jgi:hypothetical protein
MRLIFIFAALAAAAPVTVDPKFSTVAVGPTRMIQEPLNTADGSESRFLGIPDFVAKRLPIIKDHVKKKKSGGGLSGLIDAVLKSGSKD